MMSMADRTPERSMVRTFYVEMEPYRSVVPSFALDHGKKYIHTVDDDVTNRVPGVNSTLVILTAFIIPRREMLMLFSLILIIPDDVPHLL
jgi:hypothetical protein